LDEYPQEVSNAMIQILFENDDIVVVNKPEGLAAIRERCPERASLFEALCAERDERLYIVHRLDKETSGVIVFARNARAHRWLNQQSETRAVHKEYLAVTHGLISHDRGMIDGPLRQFGSGRVAVDAERGKKSATSFLVVQRFSEHTLVEVYPHTGRRHQIRVHLYSIGHPIAGDPLYGPIKGGLSFPRMLLHALKLTLNLPSGQEIAVEAAVPESFTGLLSTLERG
jgi:RluA family pseudouridine synthase